LYHYNAKQAAQKSVFIALQPSTFLALLYGALGIFACFCLLFLPIHAIFISILCLGIVLCVAHIVLLHALLKLPRSLTTLSLNSKNQWLVKNKQGEEVQVMIQNNTFVSPYFTVINLYETQKRKHHFMLIIPQRVDVEAYRKLRVLLRWGNVYKTASVEVFENSAS